jgi:RNA polymerase sigma factor (sigma-70 family)
VSSGTWTLRAILTWHFIPLLSQALAARSRRAFFNPDAANSTACKPRASSRAIPTFRLTVCADSSSVFAAAALSSDIFFAVDFKNSAVADRVRRRDSYRRAKQRFEDEISPQANIGGASATASEVTQTDLRRFLGQQMQTLPRVQREAVELAYFSGLSQREIAATTRTPLGTVKTRLQLGLRKLTQCVRPLRNKI